MPVERVSKSFKDLSMSFQVNPLNKDLIEIKNETAIARSIRNLVFTYPGERFFEPLLGYGPNQSLFENLDEAYASKIESDIRNAINNFEPRVELVDLTVEPVFDDNTFNITIKYRIVGVDIPSQQLSFVLQPTR